ncbi:unnamed protein product [Plutella xylostella]|uniref:Acyl-CoA-binding domain-containing protein 6 n=1 Tax=Plutella xylostella TaxID=51655 RepID=A0A8S4FIE0_PLUXY|nr:unnamed protein product [Plutella xylostella]
MAEALSEYPDSDFSDEEQSPEDEAFNKASAHVRTIVTKLSENQLLELYGLYKQATEGRNTTSKPGFFNMQGRYKWEAWKALGDMPQEEAREKYTELVQKLDPVWAKNELSGQKGKKDTWVTVSTHQFSPEPDVIADELSILEAAKEDCAERLTELLRQHPELKHERDEGGLSALHWAADRDATAALSAAIKGGCCVDAVDESGQTALHYAAFCGNVKSVKILLDAGASPLLADNDDETPITLAADEEIRKLLESAA